jgi:uncharacterized protein (TIGR02118 family)
MGYDPQMIIVSVMYPKTEHSHFDLSYYLERHIPLVKGRLEQFGLMDIRLMRGTATLDGATPTYEVIGELAFPSMQHLRDGLAKHGNEIIADIPMFTDVQPAIQINEAL